MGLDQAIRKVSAETAQKLMEWQAIDSSEKYDDEEFYEEKYPLAGGKYHTLMDEVWTGRKENHIQRAIEEITGQTVQNCDYLFLTKKHLQVLVARLVIVAENHDEAPHVMPTQDGFFFGDTGYNEWYFKDIDRELEDFRKILKDWDDSSRYAYWAWW